MFKKRRANRKLEKHYCSLALQEMGKKPYRSKTEVYAILEKWQKKYKDGRI